MRLPPGLIETEITEGGHPALELKKLAGFQQQDGSGKGV